MNKKCLLKIVNNFGNQEKVVERWKFFHVQTEMHFACEKCVNLILVTRNSGPESMHMQSKLFGCRQWSPVGRHLSASTDKLANGHFVCRLYRY